MSLSPCRRPESGLSITRQRVDFSSPMSILCRRRLKDNPVSTGWFLGAVATLSLGSGGCVDIVASGEEGAGASSAVGQGSVVHGAAGSGVECACGGPRGRCVAVFGGELVAWAQGVSQRCGGGVRCAVGSA